MVLKKARTLRGAIFAAVAPSVALAFTVACGLPLAHYVFRARLAQASHELSAAQLARVERLASVAEVPVTVISVLAVIVAVVCVLLAHRAGKHIERRVTGVAELAESVLTGGMLPLDNDESDDSLRHLSDELCRIAGALAERDASVREDAFRQELDARVQNAMMMAESEPDVYEITRRAVDTLIPGRPAELLMADASNAHLRSVATCGPHAPACGVASPRLCHAVRRGQTIHSTDTRAIDACPRLTDRDKPVQAAVCVPVNVMGKTVGVLHATTEHSNPLSAPAIRELEQVVRHLGAHTGMIRALETSQLQAQTDPLTGLLNRRSLETRSSTMLVDDQIGAVLVADLDHFKRLNDTHGHDAGDRALRLYSQVLRQTLRPTDLVARFGGEEFVCVLPGVDAQTAANVADRVREALAQAVDRSGGPAFTSSFGVAGFPHHGATLEELVQVGDQALYEAKKNGRDRVEVAGSAPRPVPDTSANDEAA